jgi:hypothetical protein
MLSFGTKADGASTFSRSLKLTVGLLMLLKLAFSAASPRPQPLLLVVFPTNRLDVGVRRSVFRLLFLKLSYVGWVTSYANPKVIRLKRSYLIPAQILARSDPVLHFLRARPNVRSAAHTRTGPRPFLLKFIASPVKIAIMWPSWPRTAELIRTLSSAYVTCLIASDLKSDSLVFI